MIFICSAPFRQRSWLFREERRELVMGSTQNEWNYFLDDSPGETEGEKLAAWVKGMDAMYNEAYEGADEEGKAALEELIEYEESNVAAEYASEAKRLAHPPMLHH